MGFRSGSAVKKVKNRNPPQVPPQPLPMQETQVGPLGWKDPLEKETETHSSILAWEIPWTEEPGGLQSMGSPRVGYQLSDQDYIYDLYTFPKTMFLICLQSKKKK